MFRLNARRKPNARRRFSGELVPWSIVISSDFRIEKSRDASSAKILRCEAQFGALALPIWQACWWSHCSAGVPVAGQSLTSRWRCLTNCRPAWIWSIGETTKRTLLSATYSVLLEFCITNFELQACRQLLCLLPFWTLFDSLQLSSCAVFSEDASLTSRFAQAQNQISESVRAAR